MGTVPIVKGEMESGDVDPSKLSHDDIIALARQYREAVGVIDQQRRLLDEANRVIMKLQDSLRELRGEQCETKDDQRDHHEADEGVVGDHRG